MVYLFVVIAIVIAEIFIKDYIEKHQVYAKERKVLGGKVSITKQYNRGACMNLLEKKPKLVRHVSSGMLVAVSAYFIHILPRRGNMIEKFALASIIGGAISNLLDRLYKGYVIDYFIVNVKRLKHVVFNLADVCIFLGSILLILRTLFQKGK